jgi:hypothetical protein
MQKVHEPETNQSVKNKFRRIAMRRSFRNTVMSVMMAVCLVSPVALAATKTQKQPSAHATAVKACNDTYKEAVKEAKTKKGKEHTEALAAARKAKADCVKNAPK